MAELLLKIGAAGAWADGDIISAISRRRIREVNATLLAFPRDLGFTRDGLRARGTPFEQLLGCYQYRFQRISRTEIARTDLASGKIETFGPPAIDVPRYLARRLAHPRHRILGLPGAEVWYGGRWQATDGKLDQVWQALAEVGHDEADHRLFPWGAEDFRHHLPLGVDDFDDAEATTLAAPEVEIVDGDDGPEQRILAKRRHRVDWRALFPMEIPPLTRRSDVEDRAKPIDARPVRLARAELVETKG